MTTEFDVAIVGGGPSGAAAAHYLATKGHSVLVCEKKSFPREKTCGDGLTPRSVKQLEDMGLAERLAADAHRYTGLRSMAFGTPRHTTVCPNPNWLSSWGIWATWPNMSGR